MLRPVARCADLRANGIERHVRQVDEDRSAGFDRDVPAWAHQLHQWPDVLRERLAAGDDHVRMILRQKRKVVDRHQRARIAGKRIWRVAPGAAQRATVKPNEQRRRPNERAFALQRRESFVDVQRRDSKHRRYFSSRRPQPPAGPKVREATCRPRRKADFLSANVGRPAAGLRGRPLPVDRFRIFRGGV